MKLHRIQEALGKKNSCRVQISNLSKISAGPHSVKKKKKKKILCENIHLFIAHGTYSTADKCEPCLSLMMLIANVFFSKVFINLILWTLL